MEAIGKCTVEIQIERKVVVLGENRCAVFLLSRSLSLSLLNPKRATKAKPNCICEILALPRSLALFNDHRNFLYRNRNLSQLAVFKF